MTALMLILAGGTGAALATALERIVRGVVELRLEKHRELAARRKVVLDATVALTTARQSTGVDYYAGNVSELFTRLTYLMENDGSAWDKAAYHAEATGQNPGEAHAALLAKKGTPK